MNPINIFAFLICISIVTSAKSQLIQGYRFEEEIKSEDEGFTVISLKKEGLALIREKKDIEHGKKKWQLEILDTTLSKRWSSELELESRLTFVGYEYAPKHVYLLFREGEADYHNFRMITIDFVEKSTKTHEIKFEVEFRLTHFIIAGTSAVFGGYVSSEPVILLYDRENGLLKVLPGLFVREMKLLDLRANQNESFNILLSEKLDKDHSNLVVRTFDTTGGLILEDVIKIDPKLIIQHGLTGILERDELIVTGTYSVSGNQQAAGFFSTVVDPFNDQTVYYNDFGTMNHFLDYLSPKRSGKIKAKAQQLKTQGQLPSYTTGVIPIRIEERNDGFYLLSEAYHASTASSNSYPYSSNYYRSYPYGGYGGYYPSASNPYYSPTRYGTPYPGNNTAALHDVLMLACVVIKMGTTGKVEKDASMKLTNVRQSGLEQTGDFVIHKDSILIIYKKDNEIFSQNEIGDLEEKATVKQTLIKLQNDREELKNDHDSEGTTRHWFNNSFYVWGYQVIKDPQRVLDKTRRVFYVNRVSSR